MTDPEQESPPGEPSEDAVDSEEERARKRRELLAQREDDLRVWVKETLAASKVSARRMSARIYPRDPGRLAGYLRGDKRQMPSPDDLREIVYFLREEVEPRHLRQPDLNLITALTIGFGITRQTLIDELHALNFYDDEPRTRGLSDHDQRLLRDIIGAMVAQSVTEHAEP